MIVKTQDRLKVIELRRQGLTYSEILRQIKVSKSTLSIWLKDVGLAKDQKQRITHRRIAGRLKALDTIRANKVERVRKIKDLARSEVAAMIKDPFWLTGVVLYWCEGSKERKRPAAVKFTNMDMDAHMLFLRWVRKYLSIGKEAVRFELYIHEKADIARAQKYWADNLGFSPAQLRTYYKRHNPKTKRTKVGDSYFGVLSIILLRSTGFNRKIAGWTEGVVVYLNSQ